MSLLGINPNLAHDGCSTHHAQALTTHKGQAHFAGSGPAGETCGKCAQHDQKGRCGAFRRLMQKPGPVVPADASACKYFEPNGKPATAYDGSW